MTTKRFDLNACPACGTTFVHPAPAADELAALYPEQYWVGPPDREAEAGLMARLLERYRRFVLRDHVRFVRRVIDDQRRAGAQIAVLDVGCGDGSFLDALGERGGVGMDLSEPALRAVERRGFRGVRGTLDDCPLEPGSFSLVTAFHFLEHVRPPEVALAAMRRLLAPGGELVLQVPNRRSVQAILFGAGWAGHDVPRHLINYSPETLRALLERSGFEIVAETKRSLRDNPALLAASLAPRLYPPARMAHLQGPDGLGGAICNVLFLGVTLACMPLSWIEQCIGRGASVMVRARPRA
ncbi:MAG: class I SAM-dependent methyltransferase [Planctomycetes bacterium]|nr:class I SAM-dependent methyltransferase [Planctomycetota bacterium]